MNLQIDIPTITTPQGDCVGYYNAQKNIKKALSLKNVQMKNIADKELWMISPHLYDRKFNRESILWWIYEANNVPQHMVDKANAADYIITSCEHNKEVFIRNGVKKDIKICTFGIDTDIYKYKERVVGDKFVFLWVGQKSDRKGLDIVIDAFSKVFKRNDPVILYIKTTGRELQEEYQIHDNVYVDSRIIPESDMLDLYYRSHCLVFPTRGEGIGLPPMEAMATGSLVMAPSIMGMEPFLNNKTGVCLDYEDIKGFYGVDITAPSVNAEYLSGKMVNVINNYDDYKNICEQGAKHIKDNFSLNNLGNNLLNIIWRQKC